jgi:glycosyltransferase involved in cell wall biosynthesis
MSDPWQRTPIATAPLSAVLLARDAGPDLEEVVTAWAAQLDALQRPYELILVNDSGAADLPARADALAGRLPALRVVHHPEPRGPGAALRTGVEAARHPLLFYTTCDRQYRPEDLARLLDAIDRVDLVTGCRSSRPTPLWARLTGAAYRAFVRVLFGLSLPPPVCWLGRAGWGRRRLARWLFGVHAHDPECAFRLFRRSVFRRIPIQSDGDFAQIEILAKANFLGHLMDEVAVEHRPLAPGARPPAGPAPRFWREVRRVLTAADFGPATLPPEEAAAVEPPAPVVDEPPAAAVAGPPAPETPAAVEPPAPAPPAADVGP